MIFIYIFLNFIYSNDKLEGIYNIISIKNKFILINDNFMVHFKSTNSSMILNHYYTKIKPVEGDIYNIEALNPNRRLLLNNYNKLKFVFENFKINMDKIFWKFIKIEDNEYLIQNNKTKKFLEIDGNSAKCSEDISKFVLNKNYQDISVNFKFKLLKLYEEAETKEEYMKYIEEEPIDIVIKYIDLSDKALNREGIHQIDKDKDHEELRYSVRSIFENIPWFRKIYIIMPNERVKYFKLIDEIKNKIVYIKDKDIAGFDTANICCFLFNFWKLSNFNVSDNIIYMDDDYFIGKPIKKSDFFYYDEEKKKVLPSIISDRFRELNKEYIYKEYNKFFSKKDIISPHTPDGWYLRFCAAHKLIIDNYPEPIIDGGFTHNAIPLNINYIKEIYNLVKEKYQYADKILNSKERTVYDIQFQTLYNTYVLNVKKGKVHSIKRKFYDLSKLREKLKINADLFVINTSGDQDYNNIDFQNLKNFLENKFKNPTPYEIVDYLNNKDFNENVEKIESYEKRKKNKYIILFPIILIILIIIIITIVILISFCNINNCIKISRYSLIKRNKNKHKIYISEESYKLTKNYK